MSGWMTLISLIVVIAAVILIMRITLGRDSHYHDDQGHQST